MAAVAQPLALSDSATPGLALRHAKLLQARWENHILKGDPTQLGP